MAESKIDDERLTAAKAMADELYRASEKNFDLANKTGSKLSAQLFTLATFLIAILFGLVQSNALTVSWLVIGSVVSALGSVYCGLNRMALDTNFLIKEGRNKYEGSSKIIEQLFDGKALEVLVKTFDEHKGSGNTNKDANKYFKWQKRLFIVSLLVIISILITDKVN